MHIPNLFLNFERGSVTYALRKSDEWPATNRRGPIQPTVMVRGLYARRANGRVKIGHALDGPRSGVFWTAPGDAVVESYIQARLHLMGVSPRSRHNTRMSEWFTTDLTDDELIALLTELQDEARRLDQRWRFR